MDKTLISPQQNPSHIIPEKPEWLSAGLINLAIDPTGGVDREKSVIRGYVVAQEGPFFNEWRGEFDKEGLTTIASFINASPQGIKCRFTHPTMSDDGLGKFLGRTKEAYLDQTVNRKGATVACVRANLYFDSTALDTPPSGGKPLGKYVMDLAESDPDAISSSIVCKRDEAYRLNPDGTRQKDTEGIDLPPLWKVKELHASDIVDEGDAVDGLLSANSDHFPYLKGAELLDKAFAGQSRDVVLSRASSFLNRYLNLRFPSEQLASGDPMECPECGNVYTAGEMYCPADGKKLMPQQMQNSKPHGDENMSENKNVKPDEPVKANKPVELTAEQTLREELAAKDKQIAELSAKLQETEPLVGKVADLQKQMTEQKAKNDLMELNALLDGELFHKWRTDERDKLARHLLKLKAVSEELYKEGLDEVRGRAEVKPRLNQVASHVRDDGAEKNRDEQYEELKASIKEADPKLSDREVIRLAQSDPRFRKIAQGGK